MRYIHSCAVLASLVAIHFVSTSIAAPSSGKSKSTKAAQSAGSQRAPANWSHSAQLEWSGIERLLVRSEGWEPAQIQRTPIFLDPSDKREFDIVTSARSCGSGGCTWHLFEVTGSGSDQRLSWRGSFFGRGTVADSQTQGLFDIAVEARSGTEVLTSKLKFDGRNYK